MRVGVVGVGSMGRNHARVLSDIAELVGVADADINVATELANRFDTRAFATFDELLALDMDAVVVATPTVYHYEYVSKAIDKGLSVLVEKPITPSSKEGRKLVDMAEAAGVTLGVGLIERHNPVITAVKNAIDKNAFGDMITTSSKRVSSFPARIRDVGVIMDLGIHDIDIMRYIT